MALASSYTLEEDFSEVKKPTSLLNISISAVPSTFDVSHCRTWKDAIATTIPQLAPDSTSPPQLAAELMLLRKASMDSFSSELIALQSNKALPSACILSPSAPELDSVLAVVRVGGQLHRVENPDPDTVHPIVLYSS